ncbi:MAG: lipoyl(octanoyl) transferase [Candidatus Midichloriaceae bacterium]|jgi:lipoyl(octanoyl) transferase
MYKTMNNIDFIYSNNLVDYETAVKFMNNRVNDIIDGKKNQCIWLLEHPHMYTAGRSFEESEMLDMDKAVSFFHTDRGGKLTYHGPGQKIIYVMLNLKTIFNNKPDIRIFIENLLQCVVSILKSYGINSSIDKDNIGVWLKNNNNQKKKIASIGIKLKKWISYHGIAININPNMKYFKSIMPCGMSSNDMTSLIVEKGMTSFNHEDINEVIRDTFIKKFNFELCNEYKI